MTANDINLTIDNGSKTINNTHEWLKNNPNKLANYEVNLKSLLDPTLLINTFNDLQRYYKSITIYYDYDIETKKEIHNNSITGIGGNWYTDFSTTEDFTNPKKYDGFKEILLKDLIFQEYPPTNGLFIAGWSPNTQGKQLVHLESESGISSAYGYTDNDYWNGNTF
ncbi:hypothetical protein [Spiroplasma endosymbiont of Melieria omissa]|uniref:hypothetical protein n=1 Tax=Spiroplasma endosymbiont of Melieria omissa TaxID=3139324 RepID=UPI003CCA97F7